MILIPAGIPAGGYQGAEWGMGVKEVKKAIPKKKWKGKAKKGHIYYREKLHGLKHEVMFYFKNGKLYKVESSSLPPVRPSRAEGYDYKVYELFEQLKVEMRKKYGDPKLSECTGCSTSNIRLEVILGRAKCRDVWELEESRITLQIELWSRLSGPGLWRPILIYEKNDGTLAPLESGESGECRI